MDLAGCIIGRTGSKITEVRKSSGAQISIATELDDDTGERIVTIIGTLKAKKKALYLISSTIAFEKNRKTLPQRAEK